MSMDPRTYRSARTLAIAGVLLATASACGTSDSARELAQTAGENTAALSVQLGRLESASREVARSRAEIVAVLESTAAASRRMAARDAGALAAANDPRAEMLKRLRSYLQEVQANRQSVDLHHQHRIDNLTRAREALDLPTKQLGTVATGLATLAEEEPAAAQAARLAAFVAEIIGSLEGAAKDGKNANAQAKAASTTQLEGAKAVAMAVANTKVRDGTP